MTEEEYIRVSDLKAIRCAMEVLRGIIHPLGKGFAGEAYDLLYTAQEKMGKIDLNIADDDDTYERMKEQAAPQA